MPIPTYEELVAQKNSSKIPSYEELVASKNSNPVVKPTFTEKIASLAQGAGEIPLTDIKLTPKVVAALKTGSFSSPEYQNELLKQEAFFSNAAKKAPLGEELGQQIFPLGHVVGAAGKLFKGAKNIVVGGAKVGEEAVPAIQKWAQTNAVKYFTGGNEAALKKAMVDVHSYDNMDVGTQKLGEFINENKLLRKSASDTRRAAEDIKKSLGEQKSQLISEVAQGGAAPIYTKGIYDSIKNSNLYKRLSNSKVKELQDASKKIDEQLSGLVSDPTQTIEELDQFRKDFNSIIPWEKIEKNGAADAYEHELINVAGEVSRAVDNSIKSYFKSVGKEDIYKKFKKINKDYQLAMATENLAAHRMPKEILDKEMTGSRETILAKVKRFIPQSIRAGAKRAEINTSYALGKEGIPGKPALKELGLFGIKGGLNAMSGEEPQQ